MTVPQLADNDDTPDLAAWWASIPSFAADWPAGIITLVEPVVREDGA